MRQSTRPEVFCKKIFLKNLAKYAGIHLCQNLFFNKVAGLFLLKKRLCYRFFPVNFALFLGTPFYNEIESLSNSAAYNFAKS